MPRGVGLLTVVLEAVSSVTTSPIIVMMAIKMRLLLCRRCSVRAACFEFELSRRDLHRLCRLAEASGTMVAVALQSQAACLPVLIVMPLCTVLEVH